MTDTTTPPAGQDAAASNVVQIDPLVELEESRALLAFYHNRNLIVAQDRFVMRQTVEQQKSLIDHLRAKEAEAK